MTPGHRRDFLLDSGAVSALASDRHLLADYLQMFEQMGVVDDRTTEACAQRAQRHRGAG